MVCNTSAASCYRMPRLEGVKCRNVDPASLALTLLRNRLFLFSAFGTSENLVFAPNFTLTMTFFAMSLRRARPLMLLLTQRHWLYSNHIGVLVLVKCTCCLAPDFPFRLAGQGVAGHQPQVLIGRVREANNTATGFPPHRSCFAAKLKVVLRLSRRVRKGGCALQ